MTTKPSHPVDRLRAIEAYTEFLRALGYPVEAIPSMCSGPSGKNTATRAVDALLEFLAEGQQYFRFTTFPWEGKPEMVAVTHLRFESLCAHHLLFYTGVAHVGYIPDEKVCGLSKIARILLHYSRRPSIQEELTSKIVVFLEEQLHPIGAGVIIEATHSCMSLRGVKAPGHVTVTSAMYGTFTEVATRSEFLALIQASKGSRPNGY